MRSLSALGLLCLLAYPAMGAAAPLYRITDIQDNGNGTPAALNQNSQILVTGPQSYVWTDGASQTVTTGLDRVFGFNDNAKVVGYIYNNDDTSTTPAYWPKAGKPAHALPVFQHFSNNGYDRATGINRKGQIAGWLTRADTKTGPVLWDHGTLVDLKPFVEEHCYLYAPSAQINNSGVVAVTSCNHGYRIDTASMTAIQLQGFDDKHAFQCNDCGAVFGINDKGEVGGSSRAYYKGKDHLAHVRDEATVWNSKGKPKDIGVLKIDGYPDVNSVALGINKGGQVVGYTTASASTHAFLYGPDMAITDLNTLIDPSDPKFGLVTLMYANSINDKGEIVGMLYDSQLNANRIFKLTPVQ